MSANYGMSATKPKETRLIPCPQCGKSRPISVSSLRTPRYKKGNPKCPSCMGKEVSRRRKEDPTWTGWK